LNLTLPSLFNTLVARGVPAGTAKAVTDDYQDAGIGNSDGVTRTSARPGNDYNAGVVASAGLPTGPARSADGLDASRQVAMSSDLAQQGGVEASYEQLADTLKSFVTAKADFLAVKSEIVSAIDRQSAQIEKLVGLLEGASRSTIKANGGNTPPDFTAKPLAKAGAMPTHSELCSRVATAADAGQLSMAQSIAARKILGRISMQENGTAPGLTEGAFSFKEMIKAANVSDLFSEFV
jgi:hypothetical protein